MFYIDDMVRQHAFGMKHLQLAVALIDEDHVQWGQVGSGSAVPCV